jgi:predicted MFS family arabinose efflux permease
MLLVLSASIVLLSRTTHLEISTPLMSILGFSMVSFYVNVNTMIQNEVPDAFRGRVMSLYTLTFMGITPLGALLLGAIAERAGTPDALAIYGFITGALGVLILLRWRGVWRIA